MPAATTTQREADVREKLNAIVDPCSAALAEPVGIVDLGLIERIEVAGGQIDVVLLPTSPQCLFVGLFEEEIEQRLHALPWVESVRVTLDEGETIWDESRMTADAREWLARRRATARAGLQRRMVAANRRAAD
jgi:metal-sulfur cluster biosynthetic enzyme